MSLESLRQIIVGLTALVVSLSSQVGALTNQIKSTSQLAQVASSGIIYYVDNSCANNGNGLADQCATSANGAGAFKDPQSALNFAVAGDTVLIKNGSGTYVTNFWHGYTDPAGFVITNSGTVDNPITIKNYPGHSPLLANCPDGTTLQSACDRPTITGYTRSYVHITGLRVRGSIVFYGNPTSVSTLNKGIEIDHNEITQGYSSAGDGNLSGIMLQFQTGANIHHNYIHDIVDLTGSAPQSSAACIKLFTSINGTYEYNTCINNKVVESQGGGFDDKQDSINNIWRYNYVQAANGCMRITGQQSGLFSGGTGTQIYQNVCIGSGAPQIRDCLRIDGNGILKDFKFYNNTCYGYDNGVQSITDFPPSGGSIYNNIFAGVMSQNEVMYNDTPLAQDYNLYSIGKSFRILSTNYSTLATFATGTAFDHHALEATNFGFTSAPSDLSLLSSSPAKNAGRVGGISSGSSIDLGAYVNGITCVGYTCGGTTTPPPPPPTDTTAPSTPSNLSATTISSSQINLSWSASIDNVGVTGYKVFRNGTQVGTPATNSYSDTGLSSATSYSYTVSAYDAVVNESSKSASASATTQSASDTTVPTVSVTAPTSGSAVTGSSITVSANASDNVGVAGVQFKLDGTNFGVEDTTSPYSITWNSTTATNVAHTLTAVARDAAGNTATATNVSVTVNNVVSSSPTVTVDSTYPSYNTTPIDDEVINATGGTASTWASLDTAVDHWVNISFPSPQQISTATIYWAFNSFQNKYMTSNQVQVQYWNGSSYVIVGTITYPGSNVSSSVISFAPVTTSQIRFYQPAGQGNPTYTNVLWLTEINYSVGTVSDTTAPSVPGNISANAISSSQINLTWTASTDNFSVTGYKIFRNGTQVGTSATNSYSDTGLVANTSYAYTVSAFDAVGNNSNQSVSVSATTQANASTKFSVSDRIQTTANVNVRATANTAGTLIGTQSTGALGTVVAGPIAQGGFNWWQINYDTGVDGFSAEDFLVKHTAPTNTAPTVNAGIDQIITLPSTATFSGTVSDDGLPTGSTLSVTWSKVSGPGTVNFSNSSQTGTTATFSLSGSYTLRLTASDGSLSSSDDVAVTVNPVSTTVTDTSAPSTPLNLSATSISSSQIDLSWTASTDNVGVNGYKVFRDGVQIGTAITNVFSSIGLSPKTSYSYNVSAYDSAGNNSSLSAGISTITQTNPDTTAPTVTITTPANNSTVSGLVYISATAIDLNISGALTSGVANVLFKIDGTVISTDTSSPFTVSLDTNTVSNGTHNITALATDFAGNLSVVSIVSIVTNNTPTPPVVPTLSVNLSTNITSGTAPLTGVSLIATISGTASGDTNYYFYCNRGDASVSILTTPDYQSINDSLSSKITPNICSYGSAGTYTAKVIVERAGISSDSRTNITVSNPIVVIPQPAPVVAPPSGRGEDDRPIPPNPKTNSDEPTKEVIKATIASLLAQVASLQEQLKNLQPSHSDVIRALSFGLKGDDVKAIQKALSLKGFLSSSNITGYFGNMTKQAVKSFQCNKMQICSGTESTTGWGMVGKRTRALISSD